MSLPRHSVSFKRSDNRDGKCVGKAKTGGLICGVLIYVEATMAADAQKRQCWLPECK